MSVLLGTFPSGIANGVYWLLAIIGLLAAVWACASFLVWAEREQRRQDEMRRKHRLGLVSPYDWGTEGL